MTHVRQVCEEGDTKEDKAERDFELYLIWAGQWQIDGRFQFSSDDVDAALQNFKKFKMIADIASFAQGFAGGGGDAAVGDVNIDSVLNILTTGADRVSDALDQPSMLDPSGAAGWGVDQALGKLIDRIDRLRGEGFWSLTCPRVRVHVTCTKSYVCTGNHWKLTGHSFKLEYGDKVGELTLPRDPNQGIVANDQDGRKSAAMRQRLTHFFEGMNSGASAQIKAMAANCAKE